MPEIPVPLYTTVATAPEPRPPLNDTLAYVPASPLAGLDAIEVSKAFADVDIVSDRCRTRVTDDDPVPNAPPAIVTVSPYRYPLPTDVTTIDDMLVALDTITVAEAPEPLPDSPFNGTSR